MTRNINNEFLEIETKLTEVIEKLMEIHKLANDKWNVDDTICQQNMEKIKKIINGEK